MEMLVPGRRALGRLTFRGEDEVSSLNLGYRYDRKRGKRRWTSISTHRFSHVQALHRLVELITE